MAKKAEVKSKKATAKKPAKTAKTTAKKKVSKGDSLKCEVCGLSVMVEQVGDIAIGQENILLCCGKPMKKKAKATKK